MNLLKDLKNKKNLTGFNKFTKFINLDELERKDTTRHFPISNKEWYNSTYYFDKNTNKSTPVTNLSINNLIKMYFNMYCMVNKGKKFTRRRNKRRYRSSVKSFIGDSEIKHFNNKIIISVYIYNRTKKYIFKLLEKLYKKIFRNNSINFKDTISKSYINKISNTDNNFIFIFNKTIKNKYKKFLNRKYKLRFKIRKNRKNYLNIRNLRKFFLIKTYNILCLNNMINYGIINKNNKENINNLYFNSKLIYLQNKSALFLKKFLYNYKIIKKLLKEKKFTNLKKLIHKNIIIDNKLKKDYLEINKDYIMDKFYKEILYLKLNQQFFIENFKYSSVYLNGLMKTIKKIYNKDIELNIINLKYLHLDSKIFTSFLALRLKNRKNKLIEILQKALVLPKINLSKNLLPNINNFYTKKYNYLFFNKFNITTNNNVNQSNLDILNIIFSNIFNTENLLSNNTSSFKNKQKIIYKSVKFKKITGIRLEGKGRLTERLTAARSIFKKRYKGNLKNIDSTNRLSSILTRGFLKSNIDYCNVNSKTRNGCFGIKTWINSK